MNTAMTWHVPGPRTSALARHIKESSGPLRKALALTLLVGALLWTAPLPFWLAGAVFSTLTILALGIALMPENWPRWLVKPISLEDRQDMARAVARDMAFRIMDEQGGRRVPPDATLYYAIRSDRILARIKDPSGLFDRQRYEDLAGAAFEARLASFSRLKRHATAFEMQDHSRDLRVESVPIPQPSNHEILARHAARVKDRAD